MNKYATDYSKAPHSRGIARENALIYKSLVNIYTKPTSSFSRKSDANSQMIRRSSSHATKMKLKKINEENILLVNKLSRVKPSKF